MKHQTLFKSFLILLLLSGLAACTPSPMPEVLVLGDTATGTSGGAIPVSEAIAQTHQMDTVLENGAFKVIMNVSAQKVALVDFRNHQKTLAHLQRAENPPLGVIWVVSAAHGVSKAHSEQLKLAEAAKIPLIAVFMGGTHLVDDQELIDMVENLEIADTLKNIGYPPTPVIRGSAREILDGKTQSVDPIWQLVRRIETHFISKLSS